jgi:hypothetical protein
MMPTIASSGHEFVVPIEDRAALAEAFDKRLPSLDSASKSYGV